MNISIKFMSMLTVLTISFALFYAFFFPTTKGPINCTADATMHFSDNILKLTYTIRMNNGDGLVAMLGALENNNLEVGKISRQTYFNYTSDRLYYHFVSTKTTKSAIDTLNDETLSKYTPDFFFKPGNVRDFDIIPTKQSGWVFLMHSIPFIHCNKTLIGN